MNAIDQYVAPARPDLAQQGPSNARSAPDSNGTQSFGDAYNKAANTNQNGASAKQSTDPKSQGGKDEQQDSHAPATQDKTAVAEDAQGKPQMGASKVTGAIFKLAAEQTGSTSDKAETDAAALAKAIDDAKAASAKKDAKADGKDAAPADAGAGNQAVVAQDASKTEDDAAAAALKLLNASAAAQPGKKVPDDKEAKAGADDKKSDDVKDKAPSADTQAAGAMAASAMIVAGDQKGDPNDDGKGSQQDDRTPGKAVAIGVKADFSASDETASKTSSSETAGKTDGVTVLDARRFIGSGQALSSNTHAVMSGMKADGDWAAAMKAASAAATHVPEQRTAAPVNTLKIQMTPENLGNVTATLRLHGDQLTVHLSVESGEAFKQLSHDKDGLIQSLKSQGFSVDNVSVQLAPASMADKAVAQSASGQQTGGQQTGGQQTGGQQMQDGNSAGQFAQQGRGQENGRRQQDNGFSGNWQGNEKNATYDTGAVAADTTRSGQVYL